MISFELDSSKSGVEVILDNEGINELISYLQFIKDKNDHMHLLVGNELSSEVMHQGNESITYVKLVYLDKN